jgi:uncharacterized protein YkwD
MKTFFMTLLAFFVLVGIADARGRQRGYSTPSGRSSASQSDSLDNYKGIENKTELALLEKINFERARSGLRALIIDPVVQLRARRHCAWMARNGSMIHGADPGAENIAQGYSSVEAAVNGWMNSSGHRANILNPNYKHTGVSGYTGYNGSVFWCQQFN